MGVSRTNSDNLVHFEKVPPPQKNEPVLAEVWISAPKRHGAGAYLEAFWLTVRVEPQTC